MKWDARSEDRKGWWESWCFSNARFILDCIFDNSMNPYVYERTNAFLCSSVMWFYLNSVYIVIEDSKKQIMLGRVQW